MWETSISGTNRDIQDSVEKKMKLLRFFQCSVMLGLLFTGFSSCNSTENHVNYITKKSKFQKRVFGKPALLQKCCVLQYFLLRCHAR